MSIPVACSCGAKLKAPDAAAGKTVSCPKCKARVSVPSEKVSPAREPDSASVRQSKTLEASNEALKATDYPKLRRSMEWLSTRKKLRMLLDKFGLGPSAFGRLCPVL